jgi:hypothetical protein
MGRTALASRARLHLRQDPEDAVEHQSIITARSPDPLFGGNQISSQAASGGS